MALLPSALKLGLASFCTMLLVHTARSSSLQDRLTAQNFFEAVAPNHVRSPDWPKRLTFREERISIDQFRELLRRHRWRTAYHCAGQPIRPEETLFDGVLNGYQDTMFGQNTLTRFETLLADVDLNSKRVADRPQTISYQIAQIGPGRFSISFPKTWYFPSPMSVATVEQTGERVIMDDAPTDATCPNGDAVYSLWVNVPQTNE